jgi:hypothetical protein
MHPPSRVSREEIDQLGTPLAVRRARNFLLLKEWHLGCLLFLICLVPLLFAGMILFASVVKHNGNAITIAGGFLILGAFAFLSFFGVKIMLRAWRGLGIRLLVSREGIIYTRWWRNIAYRWENIRAFSYWTRDQVRRDKQNPDIVSYENSLYYYRFYYDGGHHFIFSEQLDRYEEKPIAHFIEEGLLDYQLPLLREKLLQRSEEIHFGPFTVSLEGLNYNRTFLPWPEIDFIWLEDCKVQVRKKGKVLNWCSVEMDKVPNCCLFLALAKEQVKARDVSRMKVSAVSSFDAGEEEIASEFAAKLLGFKLFGFRWRFIISFLIIYMFACFSFLATLKGSVEPNESIWLVPIVPLIVLARVFVAIIRFRRGDKLILGRDYLLRARKTGEVLIQIPYQNIAWTEFVSEPGKEPYIGINLNDPDDPATLRVAGDSAKNEPTRNYLQPLYQLSLRLLRGESVKSNAGWHYRILDEWSMPLPQIHERLRKRLPPVTEAQE